MTAPVEHQGAEALGLLLRALPDDYEWPDGLIPVRYKDWIGNTVIFTVNGVEFHAHITAG